MNRAWPLLCNESLIQSVNLRATTIILEFAEMSRMPKIMGKIIYNLFIYFCYFNSPFLQSVADFHRLSCPSV